MMTEIVDMSRFTEAKSDQLNADDLIGGVSRTLTVTKVTGTDGDQPVSIYYEGDSGKPFKPCKTIRRILLAIWGRYAQEYVGRSMTVYRDDDVTFGGLAVGGIRISHMSHLDKETVVVVAKSKGKKVGMKILPLTNAPAATKSDPMTTTMLAAIAACPDRQKLRAWWGANNEAIPEAEYERVLGVFNERLAELKVTPAPAATAPQEDESAAALASQQEGRADEDHGDPLTGQALADQLITEARDQKKLPDLATWEREMEPRYLTLDDDLRLYVDGEIAAVRAGLGK